MTIPPAPQPRSSPGADAGNPAYAGAGGPGRQTAPNALGLVGMVLGVVALAVAIVAVGVTFFVRFAVVLMGAVTVLGLAGLVLGIVAVCRRGRRKGAAITAMILSPLAFVVVVLVTVLSAAVNLGTVLGKGIKEAELAESSVHIEVTGEAETAKIYYQYETQADSDSKDLGSRSLPFSQSYPLTRAEKEKGAWQVSASSADGKPVTCSITIGGTIKTTKTGQWVTCGVAASDGLMFPYGSSSEDPDQDDMGEDGPGTGVPDDPDSGPDDSWDEHDSFTSRTGSLRYVR